uniref:Bm134 n=1 Tax=Brugia malayi TaxID=6279 RepID=A0A1I9FZW0_BRUMA|nr:Bm134 [Brugia malayi]
MRTILFKRYWYNADDGDSDASSDSGGGCLLTDSRR